MAKPWKGKRGPRPGDHEPAKSKLEEKRLEAQKAGETKTAPPDGPKARAKGDLLRSTSPKPPEPMVPRKLNEAQLMAHATRAARKHREANEFEERVKKQTKELREELKKKRAEVNVLLDQVASGVEMVGQGELFVDGSTKESRIAEGDAKNLIAEVATHAGDAPAQDAGETSAHGDGVEPPAKGEGPYAFDGTEPPDTIVGAPQSVAAAAEAQPGA